MQLRGSSGRLGLPCAPQLPWHRDRLWRPCQRHRAPVLRIPSVEHDPHYYWPFSCSKSCLALRTNSAQQNSSCAMDEKYFSSSQTHCQHVRFERCLRPSVLSDTGAARLVLECPTDALIHISSQQTTAMSTCTSQPWPVQSAPTPRAWNQSPHHLNYN